MSRGPTGARALAGSLLRAGGPANGVVANVVLAAAAAAIVVSAVVHLHLWMTGYKHIPTIGPLFLLQVIAGFAIAAVLLVFRRGWAIVLAFGFVLSTIAGFLLVVYVGLFGFTDTWAAPFARMAFAYEVAALVLLAFGGSLCYLRSD